MFLSRLDYEIIASLLVVMLAIGVAASRLAGKSLENYYLGGRNLPWYVLGVTGMSAWFDLTGTMIITSFLYIMGPLGLYIEFRGGAVLILAFMFAFSNKWGRRSGCMTLAEWNTYRFGTDASAESIRFITAISCIILIVGGLAYLVRGATLFMALVFPVNPTLLTAGIIVFASIYTILAGFYGVVLTDMLQGAIMIIGSIILCFIAWRHVPNGAALAATARQVTGNPNWVAMLPTWHVTVPKGYEAYHDLILAALFYLARNILGGFGATAALAFAARNPREASMMCLVQGITIMFRWPLMISFAIMGIFMVSRTLPDQSVVARASQAIHEAQPQLGENEWHAYTGRIAHHPETAPPGLASKLAAILGPNWRSMLLLVGVRGTVNPEVILPAVILGDLNSGFRGFILVALLASLMANLASQVNGGSALFVRDIYQNFLRKRAKNRELIIAAYISSAGITALSFMMGLGASSINDIWVWYVMSLCSGAIGPSILRFFWWRTNAWGMVCGLLAGIIGAMVQRALYPAMPEAWEFILMTALSFVAAIVGSLLTKQIPEFVVRNFYVTTRPMGLWGPFRNALSPEAQVLLKREHSNDLITVAIGLVWQISLFMVPMQLMTRNWPAFYVVTPVFLASCVGMYFFWWKNLPSPDERIPDFVRAAPVHSLSELEAAEEPAAPTFH